MKSMKSGALTIYRKCQLLVGIVPFAYLDNYDHLTDFLAMF